MKKFIVFCLLLRAIFGFDIGEFERAVELLNGSNPSKQDIKQAYDIFRDGCDANDVLSCEELGIMHLFGLLGEDNVSKGVKFLQKSCELGYLNACNDILQLQNEVDKEISSRAKIKYDELVEETNLDLNITKDSPN